MNAVRALPRRAHSLVGVWGSPRPAWGAGGSRSLQQGPTRSAWGRGGPGELAWELDLNMAEEIPKPREWHRALVP